MDEALEADLLRMLDHALSSPPTTDTFRSFRRAFPDLYREASAKATMHVTHLLKGRDLFDLPREYVAALDEMLPKERQSLFLDLIERIGWTLWDGSELTKQDRADGYRSVGEFFEFLKVWRARYRSTFGR
jgi:hypothetical protein